MADRRYRFSGGGGGNAGWLSGGKNDGRAPFNPAFLSADAGCRRIDAEKNHRAGNGLPSSHPTFHPAIVWPSVLALGAVAGFLGIGGGFLVVPALLWFFRFSLVEAVATSLVVVSAMGLSTSASYAMSGKVSLVITCWLIVGGVLGGVVGVALTERLKKREDIIRVLYAGMLLVLALYMLFKSL
ncbi:TSUP family transporter [Serratia marcescens]|uniref:TSUP family transporter n=1 Tax=Serratia marcescens TaxID=615 RepID=UPI003EE00A9B